MSPLNTVLKLLSFFYIDIFCFVTIGIQSYTITGSSKHYVAVYCATHRKQFNLINHSRMIAIKVTMANGLFGFLSAHDLLDFYMYLNKAIQTDTKE